MFESRADPEPIMTVLTDPATLWTVDGRPVRMVWRGRRWRVSDTPTRLRGEPIFLPPLITHAPTGYVGWRFQATADDGETLVVDLVRDGEAWAVSRSYR
jgi:hypothetical protein